jgi:hypothetical protein
MSSSTTKEKSTAEAAVPEPLTLLSIGSDLHKPFPPGDIVFLPKGESPPDEGTPEGSWTCKAYPYMSVWKYVALLNTLAFGQWKLSEPQVIVLRDRLVVLIAVTIRGVTMWGVGEELLRGTTAIIDENAVRSAWSMAIRRACAYFGLGLFLYYMGRPKKVAFDHEKKQIAESAEALAELARQMLEETGDKGLVVSPDCSVGSLEELHERVLTQPFPLSLIDFLSFEAHEVEGGAWVATAVPYVRVWDYVRTLNAAAYGRWQVLSPGVAFTDKKVMVTLTLDLFDRRFVGIGEAFLTETRRGKTEPSEHAVEDAWAEAMKGACNAANLGLYMRFLPQLQFPCHPKYRSFDNERGIAVTLYTLAGLPVSKGAKGVSPYTPVGKAGTVSGMGAGAKAVVGSSENPTGKATDQQLASLRNLYKLLSREDPVDLDTITWAVAKERMPQLSGELSQLRKKKTSATTTATSNGSST